MQVATLFFKYNRPEHTRQVLDALMNNSVLPQKLFIFHDGKKDHVSDKDWNEVERVIHSIDWCDSEVITVNEDKGMAELIPFGLKMVFEIYDAVIVLEDDCVPHGLFMKYMNDALENYGTNDRVYSIGASAEPVSIPQNGCDAFFVGRISTFGWATWRDKWNSYKEDYDILKRIKKNKEINEWYQIWGRDLEAKLVENITGNADLWWVLWALTVLERKGLSLSPYHSLVEHIGCDGNEVICINNKKPKDDWKHDFKLPEKVDVFESYENYFANFYSWTDPVIRERYYKNVLLKWLDASKQNRKISQWFCKNSIREIGFWGLGEIGKRILREIKGKVEIKFIIETNPVTNDYEGIEIINHKALHDKEYQFDRILVIPGYDIEQISSLVEERIQERLMVMDKLFLPVLLPSNRWPKACVFGNEYGGYRLVKEIIRKNAIVYSFGIGEDLSFEFDIIRQCDAHVFAFDPTPKAKEFVNKELLELNDNRLDFYEYGLSDANKRVVFHLPKNERYVSGSEWVRNELDEGLMEVEMKDIYTVAKELGHKHIDVLKMDIEGSEFAVVDALTDSSELTIDQICLETHQRFFENGLDLIERMDEKLRELGFELVYMSENGDDFLYVRSGIFGEQME